MFYSHEILTSPEHGVATIWLAATLGPKSTTRKINRKAIFDVNVSGACRVIVDPEIPMALRLQGSMLYGVTRVYNQQCGYTLLDAQSMRDKMISMLKLMPGGGLDPNAGKAKPSSLILPYDPTFLPETGLPGLNIDFSLFGFSADTASSQGSSYWGKSAESQSISSQNIQIELPTEDIGAILPGLDDDIFGFAAKRGGLFGKISPVEKEGEEGILLQPDFEFDEDGNIVEFHSSRLSPRKRRRISSMPRLSEDPSHEGTHRRDELKQEQPIQDEVMMDLNEEQPAAETQHPAAEEDIHDPTEIHLAPSRKRAAREITADENTMLRNTDLHRSNEDYLANMAQASKQKQQNRLPTLAKKNAAFWVYGQGLGSVGMGLGARHETHPLNMFSGERLYEALVGKAIPDDEEKTSEQRARQQGQEQEQEKEQGQTDVEFARHAPSSIIDDHSSQMPWNISASLHSSGQRFGSRSIDLELGGKHRMTSASPLAGRSYFDPSMHLLEDDEFEITRYLENELASDREDVSILSSRQKRDNPNTKGKGKGKGKGKKSLNSLDRESLNFYEFIHNIPTQGELAFADILPPSKTSRVIATQAFMNILTLASVGWLDVSQGRFVDNGNGGESSSFGARYRVREIFMQVADEG